MLRPVVVSRQQAWQNYRTGIDSQTVRDGLPSAYLVSTLQDTRGFGTLMQSIQASEYAGKRIRLRAWVRSDSVTTAGAGLWMRIDKDRLWLVSTIWNSERSMDRSRG